MSATPAYSFVIPTYKRPDVLEECLGRIAELDYDQGEIEVIVIDNGEADHARDVGERVAPRLGRLDYVVNPQNLGPGGSLNKGLAMARGRRVIVSNDDALVPPDFLRRCDELLDADSQIGCLGFRATEKDYVDDGRAIGLVTSDGGVQGNFDRATDAPIDVEHVYGFCYAVTREALDRAGLFDRTLLAKKYASGDRIETDHCLTIRRAGLRVVYAGDLAVVHLAKPRTDLAERSERWRLNHIRNTLYLYLKQFGPLGRGAIALRYGLTFDVGAVSLLKRPTPANARYFWVGLRARGSAVGHWLLYLLTGERIKRSADRPLRPAPLPADQPPARTASIGELSEGAA